VFFIFKVEAQQARGRNPRACISLGWGRNPRASISLWWSFYSCLVHSACLRALTIDFGTSSCIVPQQKRTITATSLLGTKKGGDNNPVAALATGVEDTPNNQGGDEELDIAWNRIGVSRNLPCVGAQRNSRSDQILHGVAECYQIRS
jgi:hypothetical protein